MKTRLWIVVAALAVLALAGCSVETQTATEGDAQAAEKVKTWHKVASLAGDTNKKGSLFKLRGGEQKLVYTVKSPDMPMLAVYIMAKGTSTDVNGGLPEVMPDKAGPGKTMLYKDAGSYYLEATSANCEWTLTVWEKR
jgi:hypothetical protein